MCGIAGILHADSTRPIDERALRRMSEAITHRGPDDEGLLVEPGLGLAHRRLSIVDLTGGRQPLGNEDGSVQVIFNGEIYNFADLRRNLVRNGHVFTTQSDTEVLVHLYEERGVELVKYLRGMFAFALWDRKRRRLMLARDRLGIKPLYFQRDAHTLRFASELNALLADPEFDRSLDFCALEDYLAFGFVPGRSSIFSSVQKLPPAHILEISIDKWDANPSRYWNLSADPPSGRFSVDDYREAVREKTIEAVRLHRMADVEIGSFLSGGVDSTIVTSALVSQQGSALQTFTVGFDDIRVDEAKIARETASRLGCRHTEIVVRPEAVESLDDLVRAYDEPFADPSAVPMLHLCRLAAQHVKVVLSGDGGDEAFGGYERYLVDLKEDACRRRLPRFVRESILKPLARIWPKADWAPRSLRAKTRLTNLSLEPAEAYVNTLSICRNPWRRKLYLPGIAGMHRSEAPFIAAYRGDDALRAMIGVDLKLHLPDDFLTKVDRASMQYGLEVRPPLVDHELIELAWAIPSEWKVRQGTGKWIFRQAFADSLPPKVDRAPKRGFDLPIDSWLRGSLGDRFQDVVSDSRGKLRDFIDVPTALHMFREHRSGFGRHGKVLWSLLVLSAWCDRYLPPPQQHRSATTVINSGASPK